MTLWRRLRYLLPSHRRAEERDMQAELDSVQSLAHDDGARPAALGNLTRAAENARAAWGWSWLDDLSRDLRYAARQFRRSPGFTLTAILTLTIGIGATTAFFSQINAILWSTLPVEHPEELRELTWMPTEPGPNGEFISQAYFPYPAYASMRDGASGFASVSCWFNVGPNEPAMVPGLEQVQTQAVSGNYFTMLGVAPVLGRAIVEDDDRWEPPHLVAMITYRLWQRGFGGDPDVIEQRLNINGKPYDIIGVTPPGFFGMNASTVPEVFVPVQTMRSPERLATATGLCQIAARLNAGPEDMGARTAAARSRSEVLLHRTPPGEGRVSQAFNDALRGRLQVDEVTGMGNLGNLTYYLFTLLAVAALMLVIACANIAGLLLARSRARQREIATRLAIGASRLRLARQLATESLLLSATGGALALLLTYPLAPLLTNLLARFVVTYFGNPPELGIRAGMDVRVLAFALAVTLLAGLVTGLAPAWDGSRLDLTRAMRGASPIARYRWLRGDAGGKTLVAVQVALSLILLVGASLFIRTARNLQQQPLGYDPQNMLILRVEPRLSGYDNDRRRDYFRRAVERLETVPGVAAASGSVIPPIGAVRGSLQVCLSEEARAGGPLDLVDFNSVGPGFFALWHWPLLAGREFTWADQQGLAGVLVINESFAREHFPGVDPVGRTFRASCDADDAKGGMRVVGVVADAMSGPRQPVYPTMYPPFYQTPTGLGINLAVRVTGRTPAAMLPAVRRALAEIDPQVGILESIIPQAARESMMSKELLMMDLLIAFGAMGLVLACLGLGGTLAYLVARRTPEIGIRMAIGARRTDVVRMVMREALVPVAAGLALGLGGALLLSRYVRGLLFGVERNDPWTLAAATAIFLVTAALAAWWPARRASRIDPMTALRNE